jgi:hypothetical protein
VARQKLLSNGRKPHEEMVCAAIAAIRSLLIEFRKLCSLCQLQGLNCVQIKSHEKFLYRHNIRSNRFFMCPILLQKDHTNPETSQQAFGT